MALTPQPTATAARQAPTATPTATATATGASLTLCHALGDGTFETVTITISDNEFNEHFDHEDDVIPAPASGCGSGAEPDELVGVCHATGDPARPYSFAGFFEPSDLGGHENHPGDLIPATNGSCPGLSEYFVPTPTPNPTAEPTARPTVTSAPTQAPTQEATPTPTAEIVDEQTGGGNDPDGGAGGAAGPAAAGGTVATATYLPFTGFELQLIALAGLGFVLTGLGLRLLSGQPAVGVTR